MYSVNTLNNKLMNHANSTAQTEQPWFELTSVDNHHELSSQYANICQQYEQEKKWVLFINPEESSIEHLTQVHGVDITKVLCVTFKGKNKLHNMLSEKSAHLDIEQIKSVLCRGNCSAVILSKASFAVKEMNELNNCARLGETHCVLLTNERKKTKIANNKSLH